MLRPRRDEAGETTVTTDEGAVRRTEGRWPPARRGVVTLDLDREGIAVTTEDGDSHRVAPEEHREDVVRRLLTAGLSPELLRALLPEFTALIDELTDA